MAKFDFLNLNQESLNQHIIDHLKRQFSIELKKEFTAMADKLITTVVMELSNRLEVRLKEETEEYGLQRVVKLEWILNQNIPETQNKGEVQDVQR